MIWFVHFDTSDYVDTYVIYTPPQLHSIIFYLLTLTPTIQTKLDIAHTKNIMLILDICHTSTCHIKFT